MRVRVFHIRLTKDNLQTDQDNLNAFLDSITVKKTATELVSGQPNFWSILVFYDDPKAERQEKSSDKFAITSDTELTEDEKKVYGTLRHWRQEKATQLNVPSYVIAHNTELMTIAKVKPQTLDDFLKIKGFGGQKSAKYGDEIIAVLNAI